LTNCASACWASAPALATTAIRSYRFGLVMGSLLIALTGVGCAEVVYTILAAIVETAWGRGCHRIVR
jgi:hypothetical protein